MTETMIHLHQVTKKYHDCIAVNQCSMTLNKGRIYGLVGKNGAGKTTIMRLIAGLSMPSGGEIELFGKPANLYYAKADNQRRGRIGTLIEAPSLNSGMTAKENLTFYRMLADHTRTYQSDDELLNLVGLSDIRKRKVKDYSLGMRQRLGIAAALLAKPDFLMLDEPVNGLDPIGIVEIRTLIQQLCSELGMTVLISSHNLPELYQTATDYIIIDKGSIKKEITHEQLEKEQQGNLENYFLSIIGS